MKLNKYLSECGVASRRKSDELISEARVQVNGKIVMELGSTVDPDNDEVLVDGERVKREKKVYYILNKPKGFVTTTNDERNRATVVDLIKTDLKIFPVGRLDYNTTGVLLLTNDGEFANLITHPKNKVARSYEVSLDKDLEKKHFEILLKGVYIDRKKGKFTEIIYPKRNVYKKCVVKSEEGRYHFVKLMFGKLGYTVKSLHRKSFGPFNVKDIPSGRYMVIENEIIEKFKKALKSRI